MRMRCLPAPIAIGLALSSGITTFSIAIAADLPTMRAVRIDRDIELNGRLSDPLWQLAPSVAVDYEIQPRENVPASQRTEVKALYSRDYLYFGFICHDSSISSLRAHITDRDKLGDDDYAIVILDTYGDMLRAYELLVNPYAVQADLMRTGNNEDISFDFVWVSKAYIGDSSWTVEIAIPFKSLRFLPSKEQHWNVLLARNYPRASRAIFSATPVDRNNPCLLCQGIRLEGIEDVESTNSVEVLPYVLGSQQGSLNDTGDPKSGFQEGSVKGQLGGSVRYSPSPALAFEGAVNPDFSQVESDAAQISVNATFALFYPEKRPFFLEGSDLLQNRTQTYYSRSINNPLGAAKVVGTVGPLAISYLAAADRHTPFIVPGEEASDVISTSRNSVSNIGRIRYDLGKESFVGAMVTTRNLSDAHNYVGGFDWNYLFGGNYYFRGEVFASDTREVNDTSIFSSSRMFGSTGHDAAFNGESYGGYSVRADLVRQGRDYSFTYSYQDISPTFQAQNGFVARSNARFFLIDEQYTLYPVDSFIDRVDFELSGGLHLNFDGIRKERWLVPFAGLQMKSQTNVYAGYMLLNEELFKGVWFANVQRAIINLSSAPSTNVTSSAHVEVGKFIYRGDNPEVGSGHQLNFQLTIKTGDRLQFSVSYSRARLTSDLSGNLLFDGNISRLVATYQFSPEMFLRMIAQYNSFDRALDLFPLFSYKLNPFTIFYVGSTDSYGGFSGVDGFVATTRQYFVKLQYLWRS